VGPPYAVNVAVPAAEVDPAIIDRGGVDHAVDDGEAPALFSGRRVQAHECAGGRRVIAEDVAVADRHIGEAIRDDGRGPNGVGDRRLPQQLSARGVEAEDGGFALVVGLVAIDAAAAVQATGDHAHAAAEAQQPAAVVGTGELPDLAPGAG